MRALLDLVLPVRCAGCGAPEQAWCLGCRSLLAAPLRVHPPCCGAGPAVYALGTYRGALRTALLAYKERGRRELAGPFGAALAAMLRTLLPGAELCLVPVPSRWTVAVRRGGQHVALLADRAAAALAGSGVATTVAPGLRMGPGVRDSVGLDRAGRQANLAGRVLVRPAGLPPAGTRAVLVDDIVTSGATVAACTAALLHAGVGVQAIVALAALDGHAPS